MLFARWVFCLSGVIGLLIMAPMYLEARFFHKDPPAINRPEFYYGFVGVTLAWQLLFLVIATDPIRYRLAMLPAMVEKAGFAIAVPLLYWQNRVAAWWLGPAALDALWLVLFVISFWLTPTQLPSEPRAGQHDS